MALCALFLMSGGADAYPTYQTRRPGKAQPPPDNLQNYFTHAEHWDDWI